MSGVAVIIAAAGLSRRFGAAKQFAELGGRPVIHWSLNRFQSHEDVEDIVLVLREPGDDQRRAYMNSFGKIRAVVRGGERRQDSVYIGFKALDPRRSEIVLVHDGARPLVGAGLVSRIIAETERRGAVVPVVPIDDTVKEIEGGVVLSTLDRARLFRVQTPQGFAYPYLKRALERAGAEGWSGTDEASFVEQSGVKVYAVEGDIRNVKITTPRDLKIAEVMIED